MALAHFRMLIHELLNKDSDIVPEEDPLVVLDSKSAMCMAKNGKDTKHTRHISRRINIVNNGEKCRMHKIDGCEGINPWKMRAVREEPGINTRRRITAAKPL